MVRLFVRHNVSDYGAWRKVYDEFDDDRGAMGVRGHAVFQSVDDPNDVTVWHDFDSVDETRPFVESEDLRSAMQRAGVQGEPQIWFANQS